MDPTGKINISFSEEKISSRLRVYRKDNLHQKDSFAEDVILGLNSGKKFLLPKYFYDKRGSELFERICETEEYYPTRTEIGILKKMSGMISERNTDKDQIIELGSGSSVKTEYFISSFLERQRTLKYIPIDISDIVVESSKNLTEKYEGLSIDAVVSNYEEGMDLIARKNNSPKMILFLGSSIGNFSGKERAEFMRMLARYMSSNDRLLIGFDMIKDIKVLNDAYNDKAGITAEFNLNILRRINTELGGNFDISKFEHAAFYNEDKSRIEMHLRSKKDAEVEINAIRKKIKFSKGEMIHTENSYKFNFEMINELAKISGLEFSDHYTDEQEYFSLCAFKLK